MAMAARPQTPVQDAYGAMPNPNDPIHLSRGYGARTGSRPNSFAASNSGYNVAHGGLVEPSPIPHSTRFHEELDAASQRGSVIDGPSGAAIQRSDSQMSHSRSATPSRSSTLRKKSSLSKKGSLRRSGSRRSLRAGSVRSLHLGDREKYGVDGADDFNSAFYVPIPTHGNPTEVLANRFQAWRKVLKDLIVFFKDLQKSYESRSKSLLSASNVVNNTSMPPNFLQSGGLGDATDILRDFHRQGLIEAHKAKEVESEVILQLTGLRSDLQQKIKEIKGLSGDFKNSVDKEVEGTRKTVRNLQEALGLVDTDPSATSGKGDPFIVRLHVDKQIEKQVEEENYLHRAYLNLESSGRELESIVVGEIQKAYNAYANILKREADEAYDTVEKLRVGPLSMPKDHEWNAFISDTDELVDPRIPLRNVENISYPGKDHPAAVEVKSGMLERKSKYLKSYTAGWYVLSPTHLHEFKSADRVAWQTPVMSLYLPEQKLGSHSQPDSTSHKFMLKGRQTGTIHRGHSWVFRAESHETMMAWYEDIESLIGKTGEVRNAFVRRHVRSISGASFRTTSASSDGVMDEDEADRTPYSAESAVLNQEPPMPEIRQPGGRFPSDVQLDRHLRVPLSPSSGESLGDRDLIAAAGSLPDGVPFLPSNDSVSDRGIDAGQTRTINGTTDPTNRAPLDRHDSYYGDWMGPAAMTAQQQQQQQQQQLASTYQNHGPSYTQSQTSHASNPAILVASMDRRDHPAATQTVRRESGSTVPTTTNITDHTNNTVPTSVDENHEFAPAVVALRGPRPADHQQADGLKETTADDSTWASSTASPMFPTPNGNAASETEAPKRPVAQSKPSASTLELQIPGRYPPPNVVA